MGQGREPERRPRTRLAALPGGRVAEWPVRHRLALISSWFAARVAEEFELGRPALFLPVAFGAGVVVYFSAATEPALWASFALAAVGVGAAFAARRRFLTLWLALAFAFGAAGFLAGKLATTRADAPILESALRAEAVGRVETIEPRPNGRRRITLAVERLGALKEDARPRRIRVTLDAAPAFAAGDRISLDALWRPPQGPVRPGSYDFARVAFFDGVGATGAFPKTVRALGPAPDAGPAARLSAALERLRGDLTRRITVAVGGPEGTVAAALVTGVQGPIPKAVDDDLRAAGLSHILSISGLHMALVAGTLFWLVRAVCALSQTLALRWPVKGVAAAVALAGAAFYLALSGAEVATQRSFIMIAIVFAAVIFGRPALSPRNLALAALAVMAWSPEAVLGPSFQMSFAAVAGLIAWFEARRDRPAEPPGDGRFERARRWVLAAVAIAVMTTLVAGLATAPFAAYHFHRATPYALAGNALATPLISLIVMPAVVGGLFFAPLGLDGPWWSLMGAGLTGVLAVAREVASWPGSERMIPAFGSGALILFALGVAWLCLWRTALRWAGGVAIGAGLLLAAFPDRPDVAVDASGRELAARGPDGALALVGARPWSFAAKVWLGADGAEPPDKTAPVLRDVRCDAYGCTAPLLGGGIVALVFDARAFDEDCRRATLVVTRLDAPQACRDGAAVVDRRALAATGALSLFRQGTAFAAVAARDPAGSRPWSRSAAAPAEALTLRFAPRAWAEERGSRADGFDPTDEPDDGHAEEAEEPAQ